MTDHYGNADLERLRFVSRRYSRIQGLRAAVNGAFFLMLAFGMWLPTQFDPSALALFLGMAVVAGALAVTLILDARLKRWYQRRFGATTATPSDQRTDWKYLGILAAFTVIGAHIAIRTAYTYVVVFAAMALGGAVVAVLKRKRYGGWAPYDVAAPIAVALGTVLLAQVSPANGDFLTWPLFAAIGVGLIVAGLLEHRLLVQTLPGARTDDVDAI